MPMITRQNWYSSDVTMHITSFRDGGGKKLISSEGWVGLRTIPGGSVTVCRRNALHLARLGWVYFYFTMDFLPSQGKIHGRSTTLIEM